MVEDNPQSAEEGKQQLGDEKTGSKLVPIDEPERELLLSEEDMAGISSLSKRAEISPNLSDMQTAYLMLIPEGEWSKLIKLYKLIIVSRIAPDVFMSLLRILVKGIVRRSNPKQSIDVGEMVAMVYSVLSKGLDGKGIIDILEIAGAAREESELAKMGGGGNF